MATNELLLLLNLILSAVIATFWLIYVFISNKTFKEIKRQTDLQSDAFIVITCATPKTKPDRVIDKEHKTGIDLHNRWEGIIKNNIPAAAGRDQYLVLTLDNRGKCDVLNWRIDVTITVNPGDHLKSQYSMPGENKHWSIEKDADTEQIVQGTNISLLIAKVGAYPEANLSWVIEYSDVRGKKYTSFSGKTFEVVKNTLAFNIQQEASPAVSP